MEPTHYTGQATVGVTQYQYSRADTSFALSLPINLKSSLYMEKKKNLYNELIGIIGEQDKKCLPFVNMCLRVWMNKVADDVDLWADLQGKIPGKSYN